MAAQATHVRLRYREAAKLDIQEARDWYRAHSPALETRFAAAVAETISRILETSRAYQEVEPDVRRAPVVAFPYLSTTRWRQPAWW